MAAARLILLVHLAGALVAMAGLMVSWGGEVISSLLRLSVTAVLVLVAATAGLGLLLPRRRTEFALALATVTLCLVAIDQYFGRPGAINPRVAAAQAQGVAFDPRWAADVALDERAAGRDRPPIYPSITAPNFHARPLDTPSGGVVPFGTVGLSRNILCNEAGSFEIVDTDRHGFVNADSLWDSRSYDAVVVGDSFAEGWCVAADKSFAGRLGSRLGRVLNLGRGGLGPLGEVAIMREYLRGAKTPVVVWTFFEGNDWEDLSAERAAPILAAYESDADFRQNLLARRDEVQAALSASAESYLAGYKWRSMVPFGRWRATMRDRDPRSLLAAKVATAPTAAPIPMAPAAANPGGIDWARLARLGVSEIRAAGAVPVFVLLPSFDNYPEPTSLAAERRPRLLAMMRQLGAVVVDGDAAFRAAAADPRDFFPLRIWGHYTADGHRVIAEAILHALERRP